MPKRDLKGIMYQRSQVELQVMTQIKVGLRLNRSKTKASFQGIEKVQDLLKLSSQMLIAEPKGPILTSVNIVKDVIGVMNVTFICVMTCNST
jgi:hypothetical protein